MINCFIALRDNFYFGGGAHESSMHPFVLVATLLAALSVLLLRRKYALAPTLVVAFLTPFGEQLLIGGFHFFALRLIIIVGLVKIIWLKFTSKGPLVGRGLHPIEKIFFPWAVLHAATFVLLFRDTGAVAYQTGFLLDACGGYLVFRFFVQDRGDILRTAKVLVFIAAVLALGMGSEYVTRVNAFNAINTGTVMPLIREGKVRAQGIFANSITAGTFGATLFPLFFWLWKRGNMTLGAIGLVASSVIALTSMSSTGLMAYLQEYWRSACGPFESICGHSAGASYLPCSA